MSGKDCHNTILLRLGTLRQPCRPYTCGKYAQSFFPNVVATGKSRLETYHLIIIDPTLLDSYTLQQ